MISIWERQSFLKADIIILGGGITGLSTAATLMERSPHLKVVVLERGVLPKGASTKNAGFACFGSATELLSDHKTMGLDSMLELVEQRWKGLEATIKRLGEKNIDVEWNGGHELFQETQEEVDLGFLNESLYPLFKKNVFVDASGKIDSFKFKNTARLILNQYEGQLDTGKLIGSLWDYCLKKGVRIFTGVAVDRYDEADKEVHLSSKELLWKCGRLVVCTNAFSKNMFKDVDVAPGRGSVLLVKPQHGVSFKGTFHYEEGYYYFRDYYGKVIFGGGRKVNLKEEETYDLGINQAIKKKLLRDLNEVILPDQKSTIEMEWSGIMAFGANKKPIIKQKSNRVFLGVRLGGMGVAIGSLVGEKVGNLVLSSIDGC